MFPLVLAESLEAQQRYFSYRAIAVAIVSQNSFVLVFMGYCTIIARYVAKWGIAQMCLCGTKYQGGVSHHFGESANLPEKVSRDMGYRSDSIAVSRDMGPLRQRGNPCLFFGVLLFLPKQKDWRVRVREKFANFSLQGKFSL